MDEAKIITNNFHGNTTVLQSADNKDSVLPEWFRPYEKELKLKTKIIDLRQATEALINQKKVFRSPDVNRVKGYLNGNNVCLVKASEGRGKTFLSRIVAYDFNRENKEVYFVDFCDVEEEYNGSEKDPINRIENVLNNWESNTETKYLLVLENVHACPKLEDLIEVVGDRRCADTETEKGNVQILLNSRPTDEGVNYFEEWNEVVVLHPDEDAVREVINIYSNEEKDRNPFENDDSDEAFVSSICSNNNQNGTNLRWLGYYLWTWMSDSTINHVSDVDEDKIIEKVKKNYKLDRINIDDLQGLLYFSSIFQFGVSLHRDIISCLKGLTDGSGKNRLDRFVRKPYNILSRKQGRYSMAHSFDAYILSKAICNYEGYDHTKKTKEIVEEYVNAILGSGNPSDFESDFKLLISGLFARKDEFKEVIYSLTNEGMAVKIMKNINPGFVSSFFRPENHENLAPNFLIDYYIQNKSWLKPIILSRSPGILSYLVGVFNEFKYIIRDIFNDPKDLDNYLNANYNYRILYYNPRLLGMDCLKKEHQVILFKHYIKNKVHLKSLFLKLNPIQLEFLFVFFNRHLNCNIIVDVFGDPNDLYTYLNTNNKNYRILCSTDAIAAICKLGEEHKKILTGSYNKNRNTLKRYFLRQKPQKLTYVYEAYKDYLNHNIIHDIFEDPKDLDIYFKEIGDYRFHKDDVLKAIQDLGDDYNQVLVKYNVFDCFFYSKGKGLRIDSEYIDYFWQNKDEVHFDVCRIINQKFYLNGVSFYLDGVSWDYLQKLVFLIKYNMKKDNWQQSVDMVNTIVSIVLGKSSFMLSATAKDLSYFCYNIASVDRGIANKLMQEECVIADIKRRLENTTYSVDDLNLFGFFYQQPWCKEKLESRILNADSEQQKIINEWREGLLKRLKKRGEENTTGTLLAFIIK